METSVLLAGHHRRVVDEFIESVLDELNLGNLERNVVGVALRREVETGLVPGLNQSQSGMCICGTRVIGPGVTL